MLTTTTTTKTKTTQTIFTFDKRFLK